MFSKQFFHRGWFGTGTNNEFEMKSRKGSSKGGLRNTIKFILQKAESLNCGVNENEIVPNPPSGISIEFSGMMDLNILISGIDGYVWATRDSLQADIISNALRVQNIELEIVKIKQENKTIYLIKVTKEEDIMDVIDFIRNEKSGLNLKPDWTYPEGERNASFDQWINQ